MDNSSSIRRPDEAVVFAVDMSNISKLFNGVAAVEEVSMRVAKGTIHAIVGENGAGKTTLMRMLYGAIRPDRGEITVHGKRQSFRNSAEAIAAGIGMVSQHYSIIGELSCLDNLILGAEGGPILKIQEAVERATALATQMGFTFQWLSPASELSPAAAQKLEILKLLWRKAEVMILDEPTAMLSPADGDALFASLKQLADNGATIIVVTHRLPEVMEHCSHVTVLRGGKLIQDLPVLETDSGRLAEAIVGHHLAPVSSNNAAIGNPVSLDVRQLVVIGDRGDQAVKGSTFKVLQGEILGIAGVDGSGQRELFRVLIGTSKVFQGQIVFEGQEIGQLSTRDRLQLGLRIIAEDRHSEALIESWSILENAALGFQRRLELASGGRMRRAPREELASALASRFRTKHNGLFRPISTLSGGNQQRFVAARAMAFAPKLILAFQPARGLDINATREVYEGLREECRKGASALVVSFDLDELLEHADRIVAMNDGRIVEPPAESARDRLAIGCLMVGAT